MTFLDSLLNSHPENPALIDGVRIPVVKPTVSLFFDSIRPKHRMPFWQLDSSFLYKKLKELIVDAKCAPSAKHTASRTGFTRVEITRRASQFSLKINKR
jgi:hypothetical protein